jgi:transposase
MLKVDHYDLIRQKLRDGMSQRKVAEELGHSRNTVAKAVQYNLPPGYRMSRERSKPAMEPFTHIIEQWVNDNKKARPKQRQTAKKIYQRLCDEYGFTGHYSTVQRYVKEAANRRQEVFMPLQFEPGEEAQVDWHDGYIFDNGIERKVNFFCMKLCFSKAPFVYPYERANLESFLDGHVRAFEYFGGVPRRLAYDNLKTAVTKVLHGKKRKLNERFKQLKCWYVFETRFCNIARGNEKGDVENLAKHSEQWFLSPIPHVNGLEELANKLLLDCQKDLDRAAPAPYSKQSRRELLEQERQYLYELPKQRFDAYKGASTFADKHLIVRYDTNRYSVPTEYAYQSCQIRAFVDKIEIYHKHELIASHQRSYDKDQFILEPMHYIKLLRTKPGSLDNARPFKGQPWGNDFEFMRRELEYRYGSEGTKRYINILLLFDKYAAREVQESVKICVKCRAFSDEAVESYIRNSGQIDLTGKPVFNTIGDGRRDLAIYNALVGQAVA